MKENKTGLLFIPDISGFTQFIQETEIEHSQHIVRELMEVIINTNQLHLEVSEIEGDAVLFFRMGNAPSLADIASQVRQMFIEFHKYLRIIERDRICHCGACSTAGKLTLKFLVHFGDIAISDIKGHQKLIGRSVILAHRLMKNDIPGHEYLLLTKDYLSTQSIAEPASVFTWGEMYEGSSNYEHIGDVLYEYIMLSKLHESLPTVDSLPEPVAYPDPIRVEIQINAPPEIVYEIVIDLGARLNWSDGLKNIEYNKDTVLRVGTTHICEFPTGKVELETIYSREGKDEIKYAERANNNFLLPEATSFITLSARDPGTLFKISFHYRRKAYIGKLIDLLFRKKLAQGLSRSAANLKDYVEKIHQQPGNSQGT